MKIKSKIPKNVDPIKLADKIKNNLTKDWINRRSHLKFPRDRQF